ncbi:hypothetical protein BC937DRAFT_92930 [Endogone sp. FLAS-F59071]|nr:hypothetical protein BC937DRAFT_92930 [Endogone sp. FLAS-F59071]|eukprot:RUS21362.1 hypothetical protein BC937DRAFT_92930 [Endogone sp. FLAS-F59071]
MDGELTPRTPETLFNEALIDILIPNLGKLDVTPSGQFVLATTSRDFAFYDEGLRIYVHVRLPVDTPEGATEPIISSTFANTLFSQFDIHIEASVADPNMAAASTYSGSPQQTPAAYRLPSRPPSTAPGSSVPTSPRLAAAQLHKRDSPKGPMENVPFYAHTYNPKIKDIEAIIFRWEGAWSCLYPLTIPIVYVKSRITSPVLLLIASVSYRPLPASAASNASTSDVLNEYDTDIFDTVNLLEGLSDDLAFNIPAAPPSLPIQRFPSDFRTRDQRKSDSPNQQSAGTSTQLLTQRRNVRRVLPLRSALNVKMRSTNVSMIDKVLMMSIELENDDAGCPFLIESLDVQVASAYVTLALEGKPGLVCCASEWDGMVNYTG